MTSATEPIVPLTDEEFRSEVADALLAAGEQQYAFTLVACVPMHLPPDDAEALLRTAADCVRAHVRGVDIVGNLDEGAIAIGAGDTDATEAAVLAHRVRTELELLGHKLQHLVWDTGIAQLGRDGESVDDLIAAAIAAARGRRRDLASTKTPLIPPSFEPLD